MTDDERSQILQQLHQGRDHFVAACRAIPAGQAAVRPGDGQWSALDCAEHVAVVEQFLLGSIESAQAVDQPVINTNREQRISVRGFDRSRRIEAPEPTRPTGRFATLADALDHFVAARSRTIHYVETCTDDLRARVTQHPLLGTVNCWENLLLLAVHPMRHASQVAALTQQDPRSIPAPNPALSNTESN